MPQLVRQVEHAIRLGRLRAGDQLPSVRDVVSALGINPNTVVKAYREMESRRLVDTRQGGGTFVADLAAAGATTAPAAGRSRGRGGHLPHPGPRRDHPAYRLVLRHLA